MDSIRIERIAAEWLAKRDSGNWSDADQAEFEAWLAESTAHRVAWLRLDAAWQQSDRLKAVGAGVTPGRIPERGQWTLSPFFNESKIQKPAARPAASPVPTYAEKKYRRPLRFTAVAAVLVLAVSGTLFWKYYNAAEHAHYYTGLGGVQEVSLADGSQATLGSDSHLEVSVSRKMRQIDLKQGEAYFDVTHDPERAFVVEVGRQRVVAIGTRFSVRRDGDNLRVIVTEGRVRLESGTPAIRPPTLLTAGMVAQVDKGGVQVQEYPLERAEELLSWREGFLVFRDTPLAEAIAEFNRYNRRKLVIADPSIAAIPIGGNFRWSNTGAFVRLLEQGFDVRAEQRGREIVLHGQ